MLTVKVIDLWSIANLMKSDKMKYVTVDIIDEEGTKPCGAIFMIKDTAEEFKAILRQR